MTLNIATHRNIMVMLLKELFTDTSIGPFIGFKGGTAVYLFYNLPRFSVDLDFDLLDMSKKDVIFEKVKNILEQYGTLKNADNKADNLFFNLSYEDKAVTAQNVKVDINTRQFGSKYEVKSYLGISMKVMVQEDIFAHKMAAMFERGDTTNRDVFDVWFFLKNNWPVNKSIIEKRTGHAYKEFLKKMIDQLEADTDRDMLSGMGELIETPKQKAWVKTKLRQDVVFLLKLALQNENEYEKSNNKI